MDNLEAVDVAHTEFERRLRRVGADDWGRPTPCSEWSVHDLVNHVVAVARLYVLLLDGCTRERANEELAVDALGDDPLGAFESHTTALAAAFRRPGALEASCAHPLGDSTGLSLLRGRAGDVALHSWDLARALGVDEQLDARLVDHTLEVFIPNAERFVAAGAVAPPTGATDRSVPPLIRLLRLAGRTP